MAKLTASKPHRLHPGDEQAIRAYLRHLADTPISRQSGRSKDPVARLKAVQDRLDREERASLEDAFVAVAQRWSLKRGVSGGTLKEFGVPVAVLQRAGLAVDPPEDVVRRAYSTSPFTVKRLVETTGVPAFAVRKAVQADLAGGLVREAGLESTGHRPAKLYALSDKASD